MGREPDGNGCASTKLAFDGKRGAVVFGDMLDDRKAKARAASRLASPGIHSVEAFGQPGDMFLGNTVSLIADRQNYRAIFVRGQLHLHRLLAAAIFDSIVD